VLGWHRPARQRAGALRVQLALTVLVMLVWLSGCASPSTVVDTVEVKVPVVLPCEAEVPSPMKYATADLAASSTDFDKIRALLVERRQRMSVEQELRVLLEACTRP
jgi:hypothetical protein